VLRGGGPTGGLVEALPEQDRRRRYRLAAAGADAARSYLRNLRPGIGAARAAGLAAGAAVIGWLPIGALIVVGTAVFPSDNPVPFTVGFLYLTTAWQALALSL
jgi:hypothetical protein